MGKAVVVRCHCCGAPVAPDALMVDQVTYTLALGGRVAQLTKLEFDIFSILRAARGRGVVTNEALFEGLYAGRKRLPAPDVIKVVMTKVRKKLAPLGYGVASAWGVGYQLTTDPSKKSLATTRVSGGRWTEDKDRELKKMHRARVPFAEQATRLQVSFSTLARRTTAAGLELLA